MNKIKEERRRENHPDFTYDQKLKLQSSGYSMLDEYRAVKWSPDNANTTITNFHNDIIEIRTSPPADAMSGSRDEVSHEKFSRVFGAPPPKTEPPDFGDWGIGGV